MIKGIKNIEAGEPIKVFLLGSCFMFLTSSIYHYILLRRNFSVKQFIFELTFLCIFLFCILCYKRLVKSNKQTYIKYMVLGFSMLYLLSYDFILTVESSFHVAIPYWECFLIIFSPLFLSIRFFMLASICVIFRFLIAISYFNINYSNKSVLFVIVIIATSCLVIISLKFLEQRIKMSHEKQMQETALSVMRIMELKDSYTKGHSVRVADYAIELAKATKQYNESALKKFHFSCLLHDVGKIGISDEILNKPSTLTQEEYNIIKTHPQLGVEVFKHMSVIKENKAIILSHHERWDGNGYPEKLEGNEIPLSARIVAIADTFDAMTSTRSYRSALPPEEAYKRIVEGAGSQFDPSLIEIFKDTFPIWEKMIQQK
ncbi:HD-GYP domain-containing protein [Bacillus cereus]|uniref:HD-GYP domain-containing protein n=1 Tax=Bacillus cereus TaxID=1396 RepID=UPI000BF387B5|nr:HD-GYP domain-containing protein [Bacillus cereus]PEX87260.1 HD family phosphohydrolase [Bacillus cereus]